MAGHLVRRPSACGLALLMLLAASVARAQVPAAIADPAGPAAPLTSPPVTAVTAATALAPTTAPQPFLRKVPRPPTRWYGAPALILDGATVGLALGGLAAKKDALLPLSLLMYLASAPINHVAHGHGVNALRSLGLRAAPLLIAGLIIARTEGHEESSSDAVVAADALVLVGAPVIMLIDDLVMAREAVPTPDGGPAETTREFARVEPIAWAPQMTPLRGGGWMIGAMGRF